MVERIPYTIIPHFFNNIDERGPIAKIKVLYWKLKCKDNSGFLDAKLIR